MRAIIVDDEHLARERLRAMLADHPDVEIVAECARAAEAVRTIRAEKPDLVFLDVEMPGLDGFHVVDALELEPPPFVIFVTAHAEHAVGAFDRAAGDYLLKPYDDERLARAVDRGRAAYRSHRSASAPKYLDRIPVTLGRRTIFVTVDEIDWIEARDNYVCLHAGTERHLVRLSLSALESKLDPTRFVRVHRSAIVRFDRIREIQGVGQGSHRLVLRDGTQLPIGETYRNRLV